MRNIRLIVKTCFYILILSFIVSCKKNKENLNFHENYFPLDEGRFVEYDVQSIYHDDASGVHETTNYVMKVLIGDTVIDNFGRIAKKYQRYYYNDFEQEFQIKDLWTAIIDQGRAELVEENKRVIKLVFIPSLNKEWNMNAFNNESATNVKYENLHKTLSIGNLSFDSTLTVVEDMMEPTLISYKRKKEVYAKNVGLISKYYKDIEINNFDTLSPLNGIEIYYTIRNFGVE
jgi:hypothetical protein